MEKINEGQSNELLTNMLAFYKRRYADRQSEMETKFNAAAEDLIETGDISKKEYMDFCVTHDVEPTVKTKPVVKKKTSSSSSLYSSGGDSCGGGSSRHGDSIFRTSSC